MVTLFWVINIGFAKVPIEPVVAVSEIVPEAPEVIVPVVVVMLAPAERKIEFAVILKLKRLMIAEAADALSLMVALGRFRLEARVMFPAVCSSERVPDEKVVMIALVRPALADLR